MHLREPAAMYVLLLLICLCYLSLTRVLSAKDRNKEAEEQAIHRKKTKTPQTHIGCAQKQHTWPYMILPGLALTTSCKEAAFTFSTTSLLDMLVMGSPNHSGPFATFLKAYAHTHTSHAVKAITTSSYSKLLGRGGGVVKDFTAQIQLESC